MLPPRSTVDDVAALPDKNALRGKTSTPLHHACRLLLAGGTTLAHAAPFAYITNQTSNNVSVIDTASNTVTATVAVGTNPAAFGLFIGPAAAAPGAIGPIPTLSQWSLLLLGAVLATLGVVRLQRLRN